ncbi:MAG: hypothetical protein Q9170_008214 [Blastenia crenularia]
MKPNHSCPEHQTGSQSLDLQSWAAQVISKKRAVHVKSEYNDHTDNHSSRPQSWAAQWLPSFFNVTHNEYEHPGPNRQTAYPPLDLQRWAAQAIPYRSNSTETKREDLEPNRLNEIPHYVNKANVSPVHPNQSVGQHPTTGSHAIAMPQQSISQDFTAEDDDINLSQQDVGQVPTTKDRDIGIPRRSLDQRRGTEGFDTRLPQQSIGQAVTTEDDDIQIPNQNVHHRLETESDGTDIPQQNVDRGFANQEGDSEIHQHGRTDVSQSLDGSTLQPEQDVSQGLEIQDDDMDVSPESSNLGPRIEDHYIGGALQNSSEDLPIRKRRRAPTAGPPKKRGRPKQSPDNPSTVPSAYSQPWGAILVAEQFKLSKVFRDLLADDTLDAAPFFTVAAVTLPAPSEEEPTRSSFVKFCDDVYGMAHIEPIQVVCRLFLLVTLGEMAARLFGPKWSNEKNQRLSKSIIRSHGKETYDSIQRPCRLANRLDFVCQQFGKGCIFWLQEKLTENFLGNRVSMSGNNYEEAIQHATSKGLQASIQISGANELSCAIGAYLRRRYKIEQIDSDVKDEREDGAKDGQGTPGTENERDTGTDHEGGAEDGQGTSGTENGQDAGTNHQGGAGTPDVI